MAIRRCPYCKAIIDEQDKYCNNCGTQLLFPEDEFVEEEIPGDKIIDDNEPEETEVKAAGEKQELEAKLEEEEELAEDDEEDDEDEDDDAEEKEEEAEVEEEKGKTGEFRLEGEKEADEDDEGSEEEKDTDELEEPAGTEEEGEKPGDEDREREEEEVEEEDELGELTEPERYEEPHAQADKKYEVSLEDDELVIKTKGMANRVDTADEVKAERVRPPDTASLPPWANRIRETPAAVEPGEGTRGTSALSREWTTDSGIGIPERITQAALPFADTGSQAGAQPGQETDHVEEETPDATAEMAEAGPSGGLSLKLRAKFVDWVFVTALWVISLWFTAQVVGVSFFRLLFVSPLQVLAFYVILLVLYFFLFLYFLGETLGDHYFSE